MNNNRVMIKNEFQLNQTRWVDLIHPSIEELEVLSSELEIPPRILTNSLDPEHLPKYEELNSTSVIFLRIIDPNKKIKTANIQDLTTKVTIIVQQGLIITIHRLDPEFLVQLRSDCLTEMGRLQTQKDLIKKIITSSIMTYDGPLNLLEKNVEEFEDKIFMAEKSNTIIREGYYLKRKSSAFRKVLKFSLDILIALNNHPQFVWKDFQGLRENTERFLFYTEDVYENVTGLLNLHISLATQKTNEASFKTSEVMRVLTVFSIFFLPLNFLAGVYGMNFENMPELKHPLGYISLISLMVIISILLFIWMLRKGWMKNPDDHH